MFLSPCRNTLYTIMCFTKCCTSPHPCLWTIVPVENVSFTPNHNTITTVTSEPVYWTCGLFQTGVIGASFTFPSLLLPLSQLVGTEISFACACSSSIIYIYSSKVIAGKPLSEKFCHHGQHTFNPLSTIEVTFCLVDLSSTSCGSSNGHLRVAPKGTQS